SVISSTDACTGPIPRRHHNSPATWKVPWSQPKGSCPPCRPLWPRKPRPYPLRRWKGRSHLQRRGDPDAPGDESVGRRGERATWIALGRGQDVAHESTAAQCGRRVAGDRARSSASAPDLLGQGGVLGGPDGPPRLHATGLLTVPRPGQPCP